MNKSHFFIAVFLLILLSGCSGNILLSEGKYPRGENSNRIFDEWKSTTEYADYCIEKEQAKSEDEAVEFIKKIDSDIKKIKKYSKTEEVNRSQIVIVQSDLIDGRNLEQTYSKENTIVTSKELVLSDEYLPVLIMQTLQLDEFWLAHGVAAIILDHQINVETLANYYNSDGDMGILGLFNGRFFASLSGEDLQMVYDTAVSLYRYINETYGKEECLRLLAGTSTLNLKDIKSDWLNSIQVFIPYDYKFEGALKGYQAYKSTKSDIWIEGPYANYDVQIFSDGSHFISSPYRLELFLYHNYLAIKELRKILLEQNSEYLLNFNRVPLYQINWDEPEGAFTHVDENIIYLHTEFLFQAHLHEMVHMIAVVSEDYISEDVWLQEGFACFMTTKVNNNNSCYFHDLEGYPDSSIEYLYINGMKNNHYDGSVLRDKYGDENIESIEKDLIFYYEKMNGTLDTPDDFNRRLYMDALSYAVLKNRGEVVLEDIVIDKYPLYESFVSYLVDENSLDCVIQAVAKSDSVENIFHKDFKSLQKDWISFLLSVDKIS